MDALRDGVVARLRVLADRPGGVGATALDEAAVAQAVGQLDAAGLALVTGMLDREVDGAFRHGEPIEVVSGFTPSVSAVASRLLGLAFDRALLPALSGSARAPLAAPDAMRGLRDDGVQAFAGLVSAPDIAAILDALRTTEFIVKATGRRLPGLTEDTVESGRGNTRWVVRQQDIMSIPAVQRLAFDPALLALLDSYLEAPPVLIQTNAWWSINAGRFRSTTSLDAQQFHQDKARVKFLKVFVYLNDVTERNGAHEYITGSALDYEDVVDDSYTITQRLPQAFLRERYDAERFVTLAGPAGTVIVEDTSGFHRGRPVQAGHRAILQFEYSCGRYFGAHEVFSEQGLLPETLALWSDAPRLFASFAEGGAPADQYAPITARVSLGVRAKRVARGIVEGVRGTD